MCYWGNINIKFNMIVQNVILITDYNILMAG